MKYFFKVVICVFMFILNINVVYAIECENLKMTAKSDFYIKSGLIMKYGNETNDYAMYTLKGDNDLAFASYCRNVGYSDGKKYKNTDQIYSCDHALFDSTSDNERVKMYDAGIIGILKNGYSTRNNSSHKLSDTKEYAATTIALRVYEMLWPDLNTNGNNSDNRNRAHKYYVNKWLDDETILELIKNTIGTVRNKFSDAIAVTSWAENGTVITSEIENEARSLVIKGLEAAKYYKENGAATLKGVDDKPLKNKYAVTTDENGNKVYKTSLAYTFEAEKFKSSNAYIKINFNCKNCSNYGIGVEYELSVNGKKISYNQNVNIAKYLKDGNGKIEFKIIFTGTSGNYKCEQLEYNLEINYFDETISTEAFDIYTEGCKSNASCQHFYMLYATDVPTKKTIEDTLELCSLSCKEAEEACKASNNKKSEACKIFKEKYNEKCADCTTYINNAECTKDDSNINIVEGYDVDTANCGNITEDNNLNVLQCIINNEDKAGNSYKATDLVSNDFCSVFCKEDYHLTLPGQKEVNSGRYFSLKVSIKGTKTCYTSKIDTDEFNRQLETAQEEMVKAYNEYSYLYAIVNTEPYDGVHYYNKTCYYFGESCSRYSGNCPDYKKDLVYTTYNVKTLKKIINTKTLTWYSTPTSCTVCNDKGSCNYNETGAYYYKQNNYPTQLETAKQTLKQKIKAYKKILNRYNLCGGKSTAKYDEESLTFDTYSKIVGWKMDYDYDPTISFSYEENYMNKVLTDELDTVGNVSVGEFKQSICASDTNNSYKYCGTGWLDTLNFNDTTSKFVCESDSKTTNGFVCHSVGLVISKAKYVKQEMKSSGEYVTPTQFYSIYPSGGIVVAEAGKEDEIENSTELTNKLPVGLGTSQGVYTYALKVSGLGEYYNSTKLGRIWGNKNSVVVNVLEEVEEGNSCIQEGSMKESVKVDKETIKNGVYVCTYKVNCPDCPVECDESGCKNPNCPDGNCPVECDGCVYTNSSSNVSYKPISPGNINPNDRVMGKNWRYNENSISTALELKAYATTKKIEEDGETIYDINFDDTSTDKDFAMKITLDSSLINKIRTYNDEHEDDGGYANSTLKCYDYTQGGVTYDNIYCYSTFIDELLYDDSTAKKIKIVGNRIIGDDAESSDNLRKTKTQTSGYWTTWTEWAEANSSKWTITTESGIAYYTQNYGEIGIGPSWK